MAEATKKKLQYHLIPKYTNKSRYSAEQLRVIAEHVKKKREEAGDDDASMTPEKKAQVAKRQAADKANWPKKKSIADKLKKGASGAKKIIESFIAIKADDKKKKKKKPVKISIWALNPPSTAKKKSGTSKDMFEK